MSTLELADMLNHEVVENPLLEEVQGEDAQNTEASAPEKAEAEPAAKVDGWDDGDYAYFFGDYLDEGYRPRAQQEVKELPPIENTLSTTSSLADHLAWQLSLQSTDWTPRGRSARPSSAISTTTVPCGGGGRDRPHGEVDPHQEQILTRR